MHWPDRWFDWVPSRRRRRHYEKHLWQDAHYDYSWTAVWTPAGSHHLRPGLLEKRGRKVFFPAVMMLVVVGVGWGGDFIQYKVLQCTVLYSVSTSYLSRWPNTEMVKKNWKTRVIQYTINQNMTQISNLLAVYGSQPYGQVYNSWVMTINSRSKWGCTTQGLGLLT